MGGEIKRFRERWQRKRGINADQRKKGRRVYNEAARGRAAGCGTAVGRRVDARDVFDADINQTTTKQAINQPIDYSSNPSSH